MSAFTKKMVNGLLTAGLLTAMVAGASTADAQYQEHWRIEGVPVLTGGTTRGLAYNASTDHVLVATRNSGNRVLVFNALDGAPLTDMTTTGVTGGTFGINKIQVADLPGDAYSVYVCNLSTNVKGGAPSQTLRVYRWNSATNASESTLGAPVLVYANQAVDTAVPEASPVGPELPSSTKTTPRVGDSMNAVYNSGTNQTTLYFGVSTGSTVAGNEANLIFTVTIDEATGNAISTGSVTLAGHQGSTSYGPTVDESGNIYYFTNTNGLADPVPDPMARQYTPGGALIGAFDLAVVPRNSVQPRFMTFNSRSFVGFIDSSSTPNFTRAQVAEVTSGVASATVFSTSAQATTPVANGNGAGDMALDSTRNRFLALATDNLIVSFSQEEPLLIELESFSASVAEPSGAVTLDWTTASEIDNVGFNVYRLIRQADGSLSPAGKVNAGLIPAEGVDGAGASYTLADPLPMVPGGARAYVLEDIDANGTSTRHKPALVRRDGSNTSVGEWSMF
jgi:hypothetical protein